MSVDVGGTLDQRASFRPANQLGAPGDHVTLSWKPRALHTLEDAVSNAAAVAAAGVVEERRGGPLRRLSDLFYLHPRLFLALLLGPPLFWLGLVYVGSLLALLAQSFFRLDDFTGLIVYEPTLATYAELLAPSNLDIILRTVAMAALVTIAAAIIAFPIAYFAARYARGRWKVFFYLGIMLPLWSSYLVRVYAWKLILAKEGILTWLFGKLHLSWLLDGLLAIPVIGGPSLSISYIGTFLVFLYIWLPFMILPVQAALERVPVSLMEASADLGARPGQTFRNVIFPLALPGIVAGSIFTFSLTLGDYIIPQIIGNSRLFIGMAVYAHQGTAGNIPLAAAFTVVPIVIMGDLSQPSREAHGGLRCAVGHTLSLWERDVSVPRPPCLAARVHRLA